MQTPVKVHSLKAYVERMSILGDCYVRIIVPFG
jgi:hypothetical protein